MLPISQRPLQATSADAALFVGREAELDKLARAVRLGFNCLVLGVRGVGKTSLLRRFQQQLEARGFSVRYIEAGAVTQPDELLELARGGGDHLVLLVDGIARPELVHRLFGQWRDEVWQLPYTWVVSGNRADRERYLAPPADSFFDAVVEVDELDEATATELLLRRAVQAGVGNHDAEVLKTVAAALAREVTPRTPRNLLAAARDVLISGAEPAQWLTSQSELRRRAADLGRPATVLLGELMDLGPISASDERLLDRLGWTRARATQVLKRLEQAGLVTVVEGAPNGAGRPRRLYAPAT